MSFTVRTVQSVQYIIVWASLLAGGAARSPQPLPGLGLDLSGISKVKALSHPLPPSEQQKPQKRMFGLSASLIAGRSVRLP